MSRYALSRLVLICLGIFGVAIVLIAGGRRLPRNIDTAAGSSSANNSSKSVESTRFYSPTSFWNREIQTDAQLDPESKRMVERSIMPFVSSANFTNSDEWGIALARASGDTTRVRIKCTQYCDGAPAEFRIPASARPTKGSDHHLAVIDGQQELDMWLAQHDAKANEWTAGSAIAQDLNGTGASCAEGEHCNGAVASGFTLLAGVVRPEEFRKGKIDHALALTVPRTRAGFIACPATHTDGNNHDRDALPEGAHLRLDPQFDVESQRWPEWKKVIARAFQHYGAYVVDTGGSIAIRGTADLNVDEDTWSSVRVSVTPSLSDLPWDQVRVLKIKSCN